MMEKRLALSIPLVLSAVLGCGNEQHPPALGDYYIAGGAHDSGSPLDAEPQTCSPGTQLVYVLSQADALYRFAPSTLSFEKVGTVTCPGSNGARPHSMAVDRKGEAWLVFGDGQLYRVSTDDASCAATTFEVGQLDFTTFGMGFATNAVDSEDETLFISENSSSDPLSSKGLASLDTATLRVSFIGSYSALQSSAELTGTGEGRLYGMFFALPWVIAEVEKGTAAILSQAPQPSLGTPASQGSFAFAFWGGTFWLFVGNGTSSEVFQYDPVKGATTKVKSDVPFSITGAGVSTCAPRANPT